MKLSKDQFDPNNLQMHLMQRPSVQDIPRKYFDYRYITSLNLHKSNSYIVVGFKNNTASSHSGWDLAAKTETVYLMH